MEPEDLTDKDLALVEYVNQIIGRALRYAARTNRDVLVSFSAGNDTLPATYNGTTRTVTRFPNVMVVAALAQSEPGTNGTRVYFSNYGDLVNIAAPGDDLYSTIPLGTVIGGPLTAGYTEMSGTSMAAPAVAGLAALTFAMNPNLTAAQVKDCILTGARTRAGPVDEVEDPAFGPHNFYAVDAAGDIARLPGHRRPTPTATSADAACAALETAGGDCVHRALVADADRLAQSQQAGPRPLVGGSVWSLVEQSGHRRPRAG